MSAKARKALAAVRPDDGGADRAGRQDRPGDAAARGAARSARPTPTAPCCGRSSASSSRPKRRGRSTCGCSTSSTAPTPSPSSCWRPSEADLRGAGLSGRKVEYIQDLARHVLSGELELDRLDELGDEEAIAEIVAVRGLGQWTAEMFLLFHLERPDVLSGGDLGIRKAIQIEYGLEEMPTAGAGGGDRRALAAPPQPRLALPLGVAGRRARRLSPAPDARPLPRLTAARRLADNAGMRLRFWIGLAAVLLIAAGSVAAALIVSADDSADFHAQPARRGGAGGAPGRVRGQPLGRRSCPAPPPSSRPRATFSRARVRRRRPAAAERGRR